METMGLLLYLSAWALACFLVASLFLIMCRGLQSVLSWLKVKRERDKAILRGLAQAYKR